MVYGKKYNGVSQFALQYAPAALSYLASRYGSSAARSVKRKWAGSMIKTAQKKRKTNNENVVTNQYDYTTQYVKKKMPYRKKKAWKKFTKQVQAVADKGVGLRTIINNDVILIDYSNGASSPQGWGVMHLYGLRGTNSSNIEQGAADIKEIFQADPNIKNTFGGNFDLSGIIKFKSAVIDITIYNPSDTPVEVDVYKMWYGSNDEIFSGFSAANTEYESRQKPVDNVTVGDIIKLTTRGATPFDLGNLIGLLRAKIAWKKKFLLGEGQTAFFQHRDPKEHWVRVSEMIQGTDDFTKKGMTCTYLFIPKDVTSGTTAKNLRVAATRHYTYKAEGKDNITRVNQLL